MEKIHILDIISYTNASTLNQGATGRYVYGIGTDSRTIKRDELFLSLVGPNFDGHNFITEAIKKKVSVFIIDISKWSRFKDSLSKDNIWVLGVQNTLIAYQDIAKHYLDKLSIIKIGITGSNGKTTTKELIKSILKTKYKLVATTGNLNNQIGVPKTILGINEKHSVGIVEMGSGKAGDIKTLSRILQPDYAIITNIGIAHVEFIGGSLISIAKEKKDIALYTNKYLILNKDDKYYPFLVDKVRVPVIAFSPKHEPVFSIVRSLGLKGYILNYKDHECHFPICGDYNLANLHFAIILGQELGIPYSDIREGIENIALVNSNMRNEIVEGYCTIIKDCYNANPSSMIAGLRFFANLKLSKGTNKIIVLGDMRELGQDSEKYHLDTGFFLANLSNHIDYILTLGTFGSFIAKGAIERGFPASRIFPFRKDRDSLLLKLKEITKRGDFVYFKASRALELEGIANRLA